MTKMRTTGRARSKPSHVQPTVLLSKAQELAVNYDDPQWKTIDHFHYVHVGAITARDYPITERGMKRIRFCELTFDHDPIDAEVLDEAVRHHCVQPNRAEAETIIRQCAPQELRQYPRIGLIGAAKLRDGHLVRAYVRSFGSGIRLDWDWIDGRWHQCSRFIVICND